MMMKNNVEFISVRRAGNEPITLDKIQPISNNNNKPEGGLWCSPYSKERNFWGWTNWCICEGMSWFDSNNAYRIVLKDDAKVLFLETEEDARNFAAQYMTKTRSTDLQMEIAVFFLLSSTGLVGVIDWERLSTEYDAVVIAGDAVFQDAFRFPSAYDCDTAIVLNREAVREIQKINPEEFEEMYGLL